MSTELAPRANAPHVYAAIAEVTAAMSRDGIAKSRNNQQQGYKFRGIDDVYNALSIPLAKAGLSMLPRVIERSSEVLQTKSGGNMHYVTVCVEYDLVSSQDGSMHTIRMYGEAMDTADKATNKAQSAAYKYAAMQAFCIPTEGMEDADATTPEGVFQGTREDQQRVATEKIERLKAEQSSAKKTTKNFNALEAFGVIKKEIGEADYYRILGAEGYEKSNQILDVTEQRRIYKLMLARRHELLDKSAEEAIG